MKIKANGCLVWPEARLLTVRDTLPDSVVTLPSKTVNTENDSAFE